MSAVIDAIAANLDFESSSVVLRSPIADDAFHSLNVADLDDQEAVTRLCLFLYAHYYACDPELLRILPYFSIAGLGKQLIDPSFIRAVRQANPGLGYQSPGWTVEEASTSGGLFVFKGGITLLLQDLGISPAPTPGTVISVRFPKDAVEAMPGFYVAYSDFGPANSSRISRFYFNLKPELAPSFLRRLLSVLLRAQVRYTVKMVNNPYHFRRRDNTVLYISRSDYEVVARIVVKLCKDNVEALNSGVPGLALRLHYGVAVADSPINNGEDADMTPGLSFGQQRMYCLASSVIDGLKNAARSQRYLRQCMRDSLAQCSINPDKPYLASCASPDYESFSEEDLCE